ncbi:hypothetical protein CLOSTHATH_00157 [Hungatella hathewayi DSM 13479]|uniref:Uncharacterized protein n=1 Tax=Hungatella hathewayi DSM 13479 TaxID=566550 RepID=D3A987_9FIRM|nr:hypothetical protein CLOSTHATH_00157 [Hungatella hathewayi DSM 13479]
MRGWLVLLFRDDSRGRMNDLRKNRRRRRKASFFAAALPVCAAAIVP